MERGDLLDLSGKSSPLMNEEWRDTLGHFYLFLCRTSNRDQMAARHARRRKDFRFLASTSTWIDFPADCSLRDRRNLSASAGRAPSFERICEGQPIELSLLFISLTISNCLMLELIFSCQKQIKTFAMFSSSSSSSQLCSLMERKHSLDLLTEWYSFAVLMEDWPFFLFVFLINHGVLPDRSWPYSANFSRSTISLLFPPRAHRERENVIRERAHIVLKESFLGKAQDDDDNEKAEREKKPWNDLQRNIKVFISGKWVSNIDIFIIENDEGK